MSCFARGISLFKPSGLSFTTKRKCSSHPRNCRRNDRRGFWVSLNFIGDYLFLTHRVSPGAQSGYYID